MVRWCEGTRYLDRFLLRSVESERNQVRGGKDQEEEVPVEHALNQNVDMSFSDWSIGRNMEVL